MDFVYAIMWLLAGAILIFRMGRENRVFYIAGGFFVFLGCWWLADALMPQLLLFEGIPGVILRVVTVVVLILLCRVMLQERQKSKESDRQKKQQSSKNGGKGEKS